MDAVIGLAFAALVISSFVSGIVYAIGRKRKAGKVFLASVSSALILLALIVWVL